MRQAVADVEREYRRLRDMAERSLAQIDDEAFFRTSSPWANSPAVIVKHIAGNQRSRFTDFLTSDGEKPDRHRDTEFELDEADTRPALMERWAHGWNLVLGVIESLADADLERTVTIRGEPHTVRQALLRQLSHYAYHVGQIVHLARDAAGEDWRTLSIPRGESEAWLQRARRSYLGGDAAGESGA